MEESILTVLSMVSTVSAIVFAFLAFARNQKKDTEHEPGAAAWEPVRMEEV